MARKLKGAESFASLDSTMCLKDQNDWKARNGAEWHRMTERRGKLVLIQYQLQYVWKVDSLKGQFYLTLVLEVLETLNFDKMYLYKNS